MPRPRSFRSIPAVTLALAWIPTFATAAGACLVVTSVTEAHAAPPKEEGFDTVRPRTASPPPKSTAPKTSPAPPRTPPPSGSSPQPPAGPLDEPGGTIDAPPQDLSGTWGYSRSRPRSQNRSPRYRRGTSTTGAWAAPNPIGFYSGVSVAGNHVPPRPPRQFGSKPVMLTWAGFERAHEGSRVFLELNAEADYSVDSSGLAIVIRLRNTKVNVRNNLRALDLRYFKTPVRSVKVRRRGRDTVARIVLKHAAEPSISIVDGKEGYKLLVVQFSDEMARPERTDPTEKRNGAVKVQPLPASSGS